MINRTVAFLLSLMAILLYFPAHSIAESSSEREPIVIHLSTETPVPINLNDVDPVDTSAIPAGEKFEFVIKYEFISGGRATLESKNGPLRNGRPTLQFFSDARTNKFFDAFFKVRDHNSSEVDARTMASNVFHQNLREGRYRVIRTHTLNYTEGTFTYDKKYKGKHTIKHGLIKEPVSDILSSFFYTRTLPLKTGETFYVRVYSDKHVYSLKVEVDEELDTIKVPAGKFECFKVRPNIEGDAIFKAKKGKMTIWLTNDAYKMPVLIRSKVTFGAFDAELVTYSRP